MTTSETTTDPTSIRAFYRAAWQGLRALDARLPRARRFGGDADARWRALQGHLEPRDRLDLMVRDAAVTAPVAFAPRAVFALDGLADDEPFGPGWTGADAREVHRLFVDGQGEAPGGARALVEAAAAAWDLPLAPLSADEAAVLESVRPATRLVVAGAGAIAALAERFEGRTDLDLGDQVVLVTESPAERQLFGLVGAWLEPARALRVHPVTTSTPAQRARAEAALDGVSRLDGALVSADAGERARQVAGRLVEELG